MKLFFKRCFLLVVLSIAFLLNSSAQSYFMTGAREAGMANNILTLSGTGSVYHNPAGIAKQKSTAIGLSYENRYQLDELSTRSVAGILPLSNGGFGSSYSYFGTSLYNEQKFALGYAHSLGEKVDAGILLDFYSSNLPSEYESDYALAGEIGIIVNPISQLIIGVHLNNVSNSSYFEYKSEEPGMFFRSGLTWQEQNFLIGSQLTISKHNKPVYGVGAEVSVVKNFELRAGISSEEFTNITFGLGYKQKRWRGDLAFARHPVLGYSSFLTVEFYIGKLN